MLSAVPVLKHTHNNRILDVIITYMKELYYPPFVKPPLENDDDLQGQPSDHKVVILIPNCLNINNKPTREEKNMYKTFSTIWNTRVWKVYYSTQLV